MTPNPQPHDERRSRSRYPGTHPFGDSPEDQVRFFGRDEETEELYLRVLSVPLLVQFGRSGLGKTSLLQAGLFPRLREKPFLPAMIRLNDPNDSATAAVIRSLREACDAEGLEFIPGDTSNLWQLLATTRIWRGDLLLTPMLVFDQFEEVFTLRDAEFRLNVAAELGAIASTKPGSISPAKVVISLREDYLGALEEFSAAIPALFHERLRLEAMSKQAACAAITGPARLDPGPHDPPYSSPRFELDQKALEAMVDYLKGSSGVIEPFQLQLLCGHAEGIAALRSGQPVVLTLADFRGAHEFSSVLHNFYRDTVDKLSPLSKRRRAAVLCEEGLLDEAGHRLMLHEGQILADYGVKPQTLAALGQTRLIRSERRLENTFYEISHDRLAESIVTARGGRLPKKTRVVLRAAGAAMLVILAFLVIWNTKVQRERAAAQKARVSAEQLLTFLLGEELLGELRDTGRSTMLAVVRKEVESSGTEGLNRALSLRHAGDVERIYNDLQASLKLHRSALAMFEGFGEKRDVARSHERMAVVLEEQGHLQDSLGHYQSAIEQWRAVTRTTAATPDDCVALAASLSSAALVKHRMGRSNRVTADLNDSVRIVLNVLFGGDGPCAAPPRNVVEPYPHAGAVAVLSRVAAIRALAPGSNEDAAGSAALAHQAAELRPQSTETRAARFATLIIRGDHEQFPEKALDDYRAALAGFEELCRWDPENRLWTRERAIAQLHVADATVESVRRRSIPRSSLGDAEAMTLESLASLRGISEADPTNQRFADDVVLALQAHANTLRFTADIPLVLTSLRTAERFYLQRKRDPSDKASVLLYGDLLRTIADVQRNSDRQAATTTLQSAINVYQRLIAEHPDNPTYLLHMRTARELEANRFCDDAPCIATARTAIARLQQKQDSITGGSNPALLIVNHDAAADKRFADGDYAGAVREFEAAQAAARESIVLRPSLFKAYRDVALRFSDLAEAYARLSQPDIRRTALTAAMNSSYLAAWLATEGFSREDMNFYLLNAQNSLSESLLAEGRRDEAAALLEEAVVTGQRLTNRNSVTLFRSYLGLAKCNLGKFRRERGLSGWEEELRIGLIHLKAATDVYPTFDYFYLLGDWRSYLAIQLRAMGRLDDANEEARRALAAFRTAQRLKPGDPATETVIAEIEKLIGPG
jgi:tetratricopeptide (TPR) repeat protein